MKNWEGILIGPKATITEVINVLDKEAQRIALVVDGQRKLLGTITDGDVRRALLTKKNAEMFAQDIMCVNPKKAYRDWSRELSLETMDKYRLLQLPVVNSLGEVIGLETLYDVIRAPVYDNPVFLFAGGLGTRLYPLTEKCPKPLLKVGEKPILEIILERIINAGFRRFYISTHFMPEMIKDYFGDGSAWGVDIQYVYEPEPLGTGGALGLLPQDEIDLPTFVMNGDLLTSLNFQNLLNFHHEHQGMATVCVREYEYSVPFGVVEADGYRVKSIIEKPTHRFFVSAGIYLLSPDFIKSVKTNCRVDMPELIERHIHNNDQINMFPIHEYWLDIGRMEDYKRAQEGVLHVESIR